MRISLLEKREDFDNILKKTINESTYFKNRDLLNEDKYLINKYLNFIATESLSRDVFRTLINEYSFSVSWWKKGVQFLYVSFATSRFFRSIFSHRSILLSKDFENFLILGGNHRLRLFYGDLNDSIVILKSGESQKFIKNDITLRSEINLSYAPKILESDDDWLREEYFDGTPINRYSSKERVENLKKVILNNHFDELLVPTSKIIPINEYIQFIKNEVDSFNDNSKIKINGEILKLIHKMFDGLFLNISVNSVKISWSHGDFQDANILVNKDTYKVIDWEASDKRFYLYDAFTLMSKIRNNFSVNYALENFKSQVRDCYKIERITSDDLLLLLVEELRFHMNEEFSENFISSEGKITQLCDFINSYLYEKKSDFN